MKKRLLFLALVPFLGLASCSGGPSYKKVSYLAFNGNPYVTEDGTPTTYYDVATYVFKDADYTEITSYAATGVSIPKEVSIIFNGRNENPINGKHAEVEVEAPETMTLHLSGLFNVNYTLDLKKDSLATYKSYNEYEYSEANRSLKTIVHENVKDSSSKGSQDSAYRTFSTHLYAVLKGKDGKFDKYYAQSVLANLNERTLERYATISNEISIVYTYAEGK